MTDPVLAFRSSAGANWQLHYSANAARTAYNGARFQPMSVGRIGTEDVGYQWTGKYKGEDLTFFIVAFDREIYAVLVGGASLANAAPPDAVINLAHVIDARILASIRSGSYLPTLHLLHREASRDKW